MTRGIKPRLPPPRDSDATRQKKRLAKLGKPVSLETRLKIGAAKKGIPRPPEVIAKWMATRKKQREEREKDPVYAAKMRKKKLSAEERKRVMLINKALREKAEAAFLAEKLAKNPNFVADAAKEHVAAARLKTAGKREDFK